MHAHAHKTCKLEAVRVPLHVHHLHAANVLSPVVQLDDAVVEPLAASPGTGCSAGSCWAERDGRSQSAVRAGCCWLWFWRPRGLQHTA